MTREKSQAHVWSWFCVTISDTKSERKVREKIKMREKISQVKRQR